MSTEKIITELKLVKWEDKTFVANGKTYHINPRLSIARALVADVAKIEMETGQIMGKNFEDYRKIYEALNSGKMADGAVIAYNAMKSIETFYEKPRPVLVLCACFLNTEGEDLSILTPETINEKINDWQAEGIAMDSFFTLATAFMLEEIKDLESMRDLMMKAVEKVSEKISRGDFTPISGS